MSHPLAVIPAEAGIQCFPPRTPGKADALDSRLRGNDGEREGPR